MSYSDIYSKTHLSYHQLDDTPYGAANVGVRSSVISDEFSLPDDPKMWGMTVTPGLDEVDDDMHNPFTNLEPPWYSIFGSTRAFIDVGALILLVIGIVVLFAGYPLISFLTSHSPSTLGAFNLGGTNSSGQVPVTIRGLIDADTPKSAYTKPSWNGQGEMELVFSDEFNTDGRSFYPGDDPYWEAVNLWYWETQNLNWYDPSAVTTANGSLVITLSATPTGGLDYTGGMISSWNQMCFTGGYMEASVQLPGPPDVQGLWPAVWSMGNLGRAGYGATLDGLWPYSYDSCDVGTAPNQTFDGEPLEATTSGLGADNTGTVLSYLPGQRLSRCTCPSDTTHPGPKHSDGTFVGRSAPEIDMFEAQVKSFVTGGPLTGEVSQSAQWAPFNAGYDWLNTSANLIIPNSSFTEMNTYVGGVQQQATSAVSLTNPLCYETAEDGCFSVYGFEYTTGEDGWITWVADNRTAWTINAAGLGPDTRVNISTRPIPQEPMYMILNLGMSESFGTVDTANLPFPVHMKVDYVRVYQPAGARNIGCSPSGFPTEAYINSFPEAYTNPNLTIWTDGPSGFNQSVPGNSFLGQC